MAYKTEDLYNKAIELAKDKSFHFIDDIIASLPCSKKTFYNHFNTDDTEEIHHLHNIKDQLEQNRIIQKQGMRKKWVDNDNATLQISLYKLIGTAEERQRLSQSHLDIKSGGEKIQGINYITPEE